LGLEKKLVTYCHFDKTNISILGIIFINTYANVLSELP
jgi:hypothetical protein